MPLPSETRARRVSTLTPAIGIRSTSSYRHPYDGFLLFQLRATGWTTCRCAQRLPDGFFIAIVGALALQEAL